ncbi:phosphatase PAP2 family protein [Bradyrhizobium sp. AZCC 1693]|uniref:phosphatase PAP2 family protein n=1 Tax=Bradyrhizobium sp. AZCC 1693 TaxID=3117029 RepID=UPI002FF274C4
MSVTSGIAKRTAASDANGLTVDPIRLQSVMGRWLMFSDYGVAAQRHMAVVWSCVLGCVLADAVWLPNSKLAFPSSNWPGLLLSIACCALAGAFLAIASNRLRSDESRPAIVLRSALIRTELLWQAALPIGSLLVAGVTLSYLITSADLPLRDAPLARLDRDIGFDWLRFLDATNSTPFFAALLVKAYNTTGPVSQLVIVWLALNRRGERLAEFIAVLSLSTIGVCVGMWLVPAAGGFAYYGPGPQLVGNFSALGEMWPFARDFTALRNGTLLVIDLSALHGVVSFPSFHTMLGVMTAYALRDTRWLMIPVLLLNGTMIVATLPVGGHHLADVLAGAGLTFGAILLIRRSSNDLKKIS